MALSAPSSVCSSRTLVAPSISCLSRSSPVLPTLIKIVFSLSFSSAKMPSSGSSWASTLSWLTSCSSTSRSTSQPSWRRLKLSKNKGHSSLGISVVGMIHLLIRPLDLSLHSRRFDRRFRVQVVVKPVAGHHGNLFQRAGFLEQMRRARHDLQLLLAGEQFQRLTVHAKYRDITITHDQQNGRFD